MTEKRWLALILILFAGLGITYAVVTPIFEASDELWHYPMVRHLADGNSLPVQVFDPLQAGPWKQEASQPPLYYYLGAALTFWIDTADMEEVRWLNPHVDQQCYNSRRLFPMVGCNSHIAFLSSDLSRGLNIDLISPLSMAATWFAMVSNSVYWSSETVCFLLRISSRVMVS